MVATEVKNLATTKATGDIAKQTQEVQNVSVKVEESIRTIALSANNVNQHITNAALAFEEQTTMTGEISGNAQKMANSIEDIAQRIKQLSAE